jgi:hypothetical protein
MNLGLLPMKPTGFIASQEMCYPEDAPDFSVATVTPGGFAAGGASQTPQAGGWLAQAVQGFSEIINPLQNFLTIQSAEANEKPHFVSGSRIG